MTYVTKCQTWASLGLILFGFARWSNGSARCHKRAIRVELAGSANALLNSPNTRVQVLCNEGVGFVVSPLSSSVPVGALVGWMLLLTFKHVIADFVLQNAWMAYGKDQKTGWALPLLVHCLIRFAVATVLILIVAPKFGFVAVIDFLHPHHGRPRQGNLFVDLRDDDRAPVVLDADRRRSGAAPSDRFRSFDLHGRERLIATIAQPTERGPFASRAGAARFACHSAIPSARSRPKSRCTRLDRESKLQRARVQFTC